MDEIHLEAIERLKDLGLPSQIISDFKNGIVHGSIAHKDFILNPSALKSLFEEYNIKDMCVYYVISDYIGTLSLLYVDDDKSTWDDEHLLIAEKIVSVCLIDPSCPDFFDFGNIGVNLNGNKVLERSF